MKPEKSCFLNWREFLSPAGAKRPRCSAATALATIPGRTLSQIPGIGKRLAERLVVDLKDKLEDMATAPRAIETGPSTEDVLSALVNLGYQRPLAQKAIAAAVAKDKAVSNNFEALFRAALAGMRN